VVHIKSTAVAFDVASFMQSFKVGTVATDGADPQQRNPRIKTVGQVLGVGVTNFRDGDTLSRETSDPLVSHH
jgi:hypothetical protein